LRIRFSLFTLVALLLVPCLAFGAVNKFAVGSLDVTSEKALTEQTITVPLTIGNQDNFMAADIPLQFSEGVTLREVTFENTRIDYFDFKSSLIDNEARTVVIGLISQLGPVQKPYLDEGEGVVANLVFEVDSPDVTEITIEAVELEKPHHKLSFYYGETNSSGAQVSFHKEFPEFTQATFSLSGESNLPTEFALEQNYPNPFNPTTQILFSVPSAGEVSLAVFNVLGQQVKTLIDGEMPAGNHMVEWDRTSDAGHNVSSGVYFYRLTARATGFVETKKMMLLK
jgi:hypothetical protein